MGRITMAVAAVMACLALRPVTARGQQVVVQQPEFRRFAVPTTVLVPDRGGTTLGGTGSRVAARDARGPVPSGSTRAGGAGASRVQVRAWVHDFRAMDEALLADERPSVDTGRAAGPARRQPPQAAPEARAGLPGRLGAAR